MSENLKRKLTSRKFWAAVVSFVTMLIMGRDVAFWLDKAYTHLDNGLFNENDIAEVEKLAQAYYDSLDAAENEEEAATI